MALVINISTVGYKMEDFIKTVRDREQAELSERLETYDTTVLIMSHDGDLPDVPDFQCFRALTIKDIFDAGVGVIVAIGTEQVSLAQCVSKNSVDFGVNIAVLVDVPGQQTSAPVSAELGIFKPVSFLRVMNDLADQAVIKSSMTVIELEESESRRQDARLRTKSGVIRPLIDFDRSFEEEQVADDKSE